MTTQASNENGRNLQRGDREKLATRRAGYNQKSKVGGQTVYLRTGEYADGRLGEIFVDVNKHGSLLRDMVSAVAIAVSVGLQYGVPLAEFVRLFKGLSFPPAGDVEGDPRIPEASSLLDYVFTELELTYLKNELPLREHENGEVVEVTIFGRG